MMGEKVLQLEIFKKSNDQNYEKTMDCFKKLAAKMDETLNDNEETYDQEKSNLHDETFANPFIHVICVSLLAKLRVV